MARFGRKGNLSGLLFSRFSLIVLLILSAYLAKSVYERYQVEREMAGRLDETQQRYDALSERKGSLLDRVEYLEGDSGIESAIRRNFDVAKEGERVVIIVDEEGEGGPQFTDGIDPAVADDEPWYKFW